MQKQANFFEQHVQWLALGLGGLFLAFMLFQYVVQKPVKVQVGSEDVGPAEVDPKTVNGPLKSLKQAIADPTMPEIKQEDYVQVFLTAMKGGDEKTQVAVLSRYGINSARGTLQAAAPAPGTEVVGIGPGDPKAEKPIKEPIKPPAAKPLTFTIGRSTVTYQDPKWEPQGRVGEVPKMIDADVDWVSWNFEIPAKQLSDAFAKALDEEKIFKAGFANPTLFFQTTVVDVVLTRQQVLPGGKYGKEEEVRPLANTQLPPYPEKDATNQQIQDYLTYVFGHYGELTNPVFYDWKGGDLWYEPGPQTDLLLDQQRSMSREQKKAAHEQAMLAAQQKAQAAAGAARGARRLPGGADMENMDMDGMDGMVGGRPPFMPRPAPAGVRQPGFPPVGVRPGAAAAQQPATLQIANGRFLVAPEMPSIQIIAHDDSVTPGKTYRYRLKYRIYNPVYNSNATTAELSKPFAIESPVSTWTKPITIRPKIEFFLADVGTERAKFETFKWKDNRMVKATVSANPGDAIGDTGWTVVDVRSGASRSKAYILIMDEAGQIARRDVESDTNSDRYFDLTDLVGIAAVGMTTPK